MLPDTREKVIRALDELGYTPNLLARAMRTRKTGTIGVLVASVTNPFYPEVIEALDARLAGAGHRMLLLTTGGLGESNALDAIHEGLIDGLVFTTATSKAEPLAAALARQGPIVLVNRGLSGVECDQVTTDNVGGGAVAARYLHHWGHRTIGCIGGVPEASTALEREQGFRDELRRQGVPLPGRLYRPGYFSHDLAYRAVRELLSERRPPSALFCANDVMALAAVNAAKSLGYLVPDDLWIVGFDDIRMAAWESFDLTTVRQPVTEMVDMAVDLLLARIDNPDKPPEVVRYPSELIVRGSTADRPVV